MARPGPADARYYPGVITLPNVVAVAADRPDAASARFSNFGATTVDLAAPGTNILSTYPANLIAGPVLRWSAGTSMARPT